MTQANEQGATPAGLNPWTAIVDYAVDAWQRGVLFLDVLRQRGNQYLEHMAMQAPNVLEFEADLVLDGRTLPRPVNYGLVAITPPPGVVIDREEAAVRRRRPARRPWPGDRRLQGRQRDRRRHGCRAPVLFRRLPAGSDAGTDDRGHHGGAGRVPRAGDRAAPRCRRQAGGDRQLPGRLGHDAGGRDQARAVRPDHRRRRAALLLGRRARPEPDALFRRPLWRQLADGAGRRSRPRHLRRGGAGPELREHEPVQHALVQAVRPLRQDRHRGAALSRLREMVGRPCPAQRRGDAVDRRQSVRRQQAGHGRDRDRGRGADRPAQHHLADHLLLLARATTSRRRSRRWAGSSTCIGTSTTSAPTARPSSTACTTRSAIWASSSPAAWRRRSTRSSPPTSTSSTACRPGSTRRCSRRGRGAWMPERPRGRRLSGAVRAAHARRHPRLGGNDLEDERKFAAVARLSEVNLGLYRTFLQPWVRAVDHRAVGASCSGG